MKTSRRTFLRSGAMAVAGALVLKDTLLAQSAVKKNPGGIVGLQLYSVRDDMKSDPLSTLKQLKAMGYMYVEHANYVDRKFYGFAPKEFRKILDDIGLHMISGHTSMGLEHWDDSKKDFTDKWKWTVEDAAILNQKYVVSPWMDEKMRDTYDNLVKYLDVFNRCGELCNRNGMKFGYHNHDFEFSNQLNGQKIFDIMMKNMDPHKVVMQLDMGNLYNGGAIALDVVNKYPGRFELIHAKDEIKSTDPKSKEPYESCVLGEGIVGAQKVIDLTTRIGSTRVYIIEQESYQHRTPLESVKADLEAMKKWGYL
ncbi:MAG TPA: TIM barrel protein [Bacteroidales bacterium]|nr:TIM barrel protein [Bacteroidales bacterium]